MTITRSAGFAVGPYIVGGGYSGKTPELDETVQRCAELLVGHYQRDVEIRFNSDRQSGGAWLKDDAPGLENSAQIGLGACYQVVWPDSEEPADLSSAEIARLPRRLAVTVYVKAKHLPDTSLARLLGYAWRYFDTPEQGLAWLIANTVNT